MAALALLRPRISFGLLRRLARAAVPAGLGDPSAETYVLTLLAGGQPLTHADLVAATRTWLARRERVIGGGVADLGLLGDGLWQREAECVVARVLGDREVGKWGNGEVAAERHR